MQDQSEVIAFLAEPATHGVSGPVERADTHGAVVFLAGDRALKLKRAVRFDYMDFSTPAKRRAACEAEVRINRRTAPTIYRGVVAVTRGPNRHLAIGGGGEVVDWLVEMARFDQDTLFDRLAIRDTLTAPLMIELARVVAAFHAAAEPRTDRGGAAAMATVIDSNAAQFAQFVGSVFEVQAADNATEACHEAVRRHHSLLEERRERGLVRHCHGDLHLRNICLVEGRSTLFDAIEFNEHLACIDVLYDFAFLAMDLWHRVLTSHANLVFNRYLWGKVDLAGLALMPLFLAVRAAVRAHVSAASAASQPDTGEAEALRDEARAYLALASRFLAPPPPRLLVLGGLSGAGKSTLARSLAPALGAAPGAVVLRSDVIRKELCGVDPACRLGPDGYTPAMNERVYRALGERSAVALAAGHAVILDAAHSREAERRAAEEVAAGAGVSFAGLWLDAPEAVLIGRVGERRADESDASVEVVKAQLGYDLGTLTWPRIDAAGTSDAVLAQARRALELERARL